MVAGMGVGGGGGRGRWGREKEREKGRGREGEGGREGGRYVGGGEERERVWDKGE